MRERGKMEPWLMQDMDEEGNEEAEREGTTVVRFCLWVRSYMESSAQARIEKPTWAGDPEGR